MKHIRQINNKAKELKTVGCAECRSACQSACKTSCTVGNQSCENKENKQ